MAGCSTTRCFVGFSFCALASSFHNRRQLQLSRNKCITQILGGKEIKFCCCNTGDLCNSKLTNLSFFEKVKERAKGFLKIIG
ncbi:unnamed protein product [Haemonchus placei]|uniref:Activin_recp domain-containing protein n=1 Tax=Haemonchus placei TaxID=6290 RepID=A0A0N4VVB9_HAEPC|nr:unnamed protein product [Haemonchus placei]